MGATQTKPIPDSDAPALVRRLSTNTGRKVLDDVTLLTGKVFSEQELPRLAFELGVANLIGKVLVFGAAPAYLWLYALCEYPYLLFHNLRHWPREGKLLYLAEFCWYINTLGWLYLGIEALHASPLLTRDTVLWLTDELRLSAGRAFFAIANGPLAVSVLMNRNALVFHDTERTASFFIHFTPALVSYTMRWRFHECTAVEAAAARLSRRGFSRLLARLPWIAAPPPAPERSSAALQSCPAVDGLFALNRAAQVPTDVWRDLFYMPLAMYVAWWLVYGVWLLTVGHKLPQRGWGGSSFADAQPTIKKLFGLPLSRPRAQACAYLLVHLTAVMLLFLVLPPLLYRSSVAHATFLCVLLYSAVRAGASYYHYAFGRKIAKALQKALENELLGPKPE